MGLTMDGPAAQGIWLAWGVGVPADLFDGYWCSNVGAYDGRRGVWEAHHSERIEQPQGTGENRGEKGYLKG